MAKGYLTFEFETLADLENQLKFTLGLGQKSERGVMLPTGPFRYPEVAPEQAPVTGPRGVLGTPGAYMTAGVTVGAGVATEPDKAEPKVDKTPTAEPRTASSIDAETRQLNKEAAAAALAAAKQTVEPVKEPLQDVAAGATCAQTAQGPMVSVTLDNLTTVEYPVLLTFCEQNPGVGIDASKHQTAYFRKLLEHKIKTFLESK